VRAAAPDDADGRVHTAGTDPPHGRIGWLAAGLALAWAVVIHHGVGPPPTGDSRQWYEPIGFLGRDGPLAFVYDSLPLALGVLGLPALAANVVIWITNVSVLARTLGVIALLATGLFVFYGGFAPFPWQFFGPLGSATLCGTAFWAGLAVTAPLLASRWPRVGPVTRLVVTLPIACAAVAFVRNATGTDPNLRFAISPWPAVAIFGIEVAGGFFASVWLGVAVVLGFAPRRVAEAGEPIAQPIPGRGARSMRLAAAVVLGLAVAFAGLRAAAAAGLFPFPVGLRTWLPAAFVVVATAGLAIATADPRDPRILARRTRAFGLAAVLIAVPLAIGEFLVQRDYDRTRRIHAQAIIDALERHFARESLYPESLAALVAAGDLASVPEPEIGFRVLGAQPFGYHDFGTSYLLEFSAPRWVECAYSPPYVDEDEDDESAAEDEELDGSWSCPAEPPELW
jgi:hypothetical protein